MADIIGPGCGSLVLSAAQEFNLYVADTEQKKKRVLENFPEYFFKTLSGPTSVKNTLAERVVSRLHMEKSVASMTPAVTIDLLPILNDYCATKANSGRVLNGGWWPAGGKWSYSPDNGNLRLHAVSQPSQYLNVTAFFDQPSRSVATNGSSGVVPYSDPLLTTLGFSLSQLQLASEIFSGLFMDLIRDAVLAYANANPYIAFGASFAFTRYNYDTYLIIDFSNQVQLLQKTANDVRTAASEMQNVSAIAAIQASPNVSEQRAAAAVSPSASL